MSRVANGWVSAAIAVPGHDKVDDHDEIDGVSEMELEEVLRAGASLYID